MSVIDTKLEGFLHATIWFFYPFDFARSLSFAHSTDPTELVDGYKQPSGSAGVANYENDE
jgi:hypothetical protein